MFITIIFSHLAHSVLGGLKTDFRIYSYVTFTLDIIFIIITPNLTATLWAELRLKLSAFLEKKAQKSGNCLAAHHWLRSSGFGLDLGPRDMKL